MNHVTRWTADEEREIARIMAAESLSRIQAIQAMWRRKKSANSLSRRLRLDPFESAHCQNRRCMECALASGELDSEMAAFLDLTLNGKEQSGEYFVVRRDPNAEMQVGSVVFRGLYPVSARLECEADGPELVPKEPYEPALELTEAGIIESRVYSRVRRSQAQSATFDENSPLPVPEAITAANVDGLSGFTDTLTVEPSAANGNKALRGRPRVSEAQKRLAASERQARWREKGRAAK